MNKTELIEHIAVHADISKAAAARALEATIGAVKATLKKAALYRWLVLVHLRLANAQHAWVAIPELVMRLKSRRPKCQNSVRAKR